MVIDANVILRHVLADHAELSARSNKLLEPVREGGSEALLLHSVLAECVYVLEGQPGIDRAAIASKLLLVCGYRGLTGENLPRARLALQFYGSLRVSFVDALVACTAQEYGMGMMTFDKDLVKFSARFFAGSA